MEYEDKDTHRLSIQRYRIKRDYIINIEVNLMMMVMRREKMLPRIDKKRVWVSERERYVQLYL